MATPVFRNLAPSPRQLVNGCQQFDSPGHRGAPHRSGHGRRDFDELARDCHVDPAETLARVDAVALRLLAVVDDVFDDPSLHPFASDLPARFGELLAANVNACRRRL